MANAPTHRPPVPVTTWAARTADVAGTTVHRLLPRRAARTVGAWCFLDHFGPATVDGSAPMSVGAHPHLGLHTVTWLFEGRLVHADSLGTEQPIRPGQLNLMTAGNGVAHAEDGRAMASGTVHGVQLWVAQPDATRRGPAGFAHHAELPSVRLASGTATVLLGELDGHASPAGVDTPIVGADLALDGRVDLTLRPDFEHGIAVLAGGITVEGTSAGADEFALLGSGRHGIAVEAAPGTRALLLGGRPFEEELFMWWNFVGRDAGDIDRAIADWQDGSPRFGEVATTLDRMSAPTPVWRR